MVDKSRIAVNFDLSVKECKAVFNGSRSKAYLVLKKDLTEHGFVHDQGSGYISDTSLTRAEILNSLVTLMDRQKWLSACCKKLRVTRIAEDIFSGEAHGDLMKALDDIAGSVTATPAIKKKVPRKKVDNTEFETITVGELAERRKRERALQTAKDNGKGPSDRGGVER